MTIKIKTFANLKDYLPEEFKMNVEENTSIRDLKELLIRRYPQIQSILDNSRFAINEEFVEDVAIIRKNQIVYIIPPVSGG